MDGILYEDESNVRSQLVLSYQGLFKETEVGHPTMDGVRFCLYQRGWAVIIRERVHEGGSHPGFKGDGGG